MKKIIFAILGVISILAIVSFSSAAMMIPAADQAKENSQAPEKSPVISEGANGNWWLERVDFIHYLRPSQPGKPSKTVNCYKLMGVKWNNLPVDYIVNPNNTEGLESSFITQAILNAAETWDEATSKELFDNNVSLDASLSYGIQDYKNVIAFGDYPDSKVIAITSVWYTRVDKKIVEFDMLFNTRFNWGNAEINQSLMDLQNIATHEFGHAVGLNDVYNTNCSDVTMYGYSTEGEIAKRTLETADITGLQKLYGI